jgi:GTP-binding protein HflX
LQSDPIIPSVKDRRAVVVGLRTTQPSWLVEEHLDELEELARSAGAEVLDRYVQRRAHPDPATFIGAGKAEEISNAAVDLGAELMVVDEELSPAQIRNLEKVTKIAVLDRAALILEIFRQRARTNEAKKQVELAQLQYLLPRLTRRWSHLSRQGGRQGIRGGEGESQLEADRRILRRRIAQLQREIKTIARTREVQRQGRRAVPQVALAGYTNVGKSTLFNRLTKAGALAQDRLFATLDAKLRRGSVGAGTQVVFSDTVGFIRKLPHHLVASFRSTLEEVVEADLVLHVIDRSNPRFEEQIEVAEGVLQELGVDPTRILRVMNKIDRIPGVDPRAGRDEVWLSAETGAGLDGLKDVIRQRLGLAVPEWELVEG